MYDASNGGLVDAHAEGDCGDDDRDLPVHKFLLDFATIAVLQSGVIGLAREAFLPQLEMSNLKLF